MEEKAEKLSKPRQIMGVRGIKKLGSLFDGISGFPLAATRAGMTPVWANEIEPFPMKVSAIRFPIMKQLGDVTKINGAEIEPVDVITFGSPCQDLSIAGKRAGLEGGRSGLFMEAVRIIREMREVTNGLYPRYAVWENVPGAFSSNRGRDFRAVISELAGREVSMPKSGKWGGAGLVRGNGCSLAWRVLDAQYWGVPQRRRRIFVVADFRGQTAPEILFEPESVSRDIAESRSKRERIAESVTDGSGTTGKLIFSCSGFSNYQEDKIAATQRACMAKQTDVDLVVYGADLSQKAEAIGFKEEVAACLTSGNHASHRAHVLQSAGFCHKASDKAGIGYCKEVSPTLKAAYGPAVIHPQVTGTLCASGAGLSRPAGMGSETDLVVAYSIAGNTIDRKLENGGNGKGVNEEVSFTLNTIDRHAVAYSFDSLSSNSMKSSNPVSGCRQVETAKCLDASYPDPSKNQGGIAIVSSVDCRNHCEIEELSGTLQSKQQGYSLNYQNPVRVGYAVRRLTPLECERLQGFPDGWTDIPGASDTARYKALGNSVAIPCVQFIMNGLARYL